MSILIKEKKESYNSINAEKHFELAGELTLDV